MGLGAMIQCSVKESKDVMKAPRSKLQALCVAVFVFWGFSLSARSDDSAKAREELGRWIMTYYQHPEPAQLVDRVQGMSKLGMLFDPRPTARPDANVMFLGKIMAANPNKISPWMKALAGLSVSEMTVLKRAVWYSGTPEGKTWLQQHGEGALAEGPRPMLLDENPVMSLEPHHLDALWEWFFATGDEKPVGRIVSLFSLAPELPRSNSLDLLQPPRKAESVPAIKSDETIIRGGQLTQLDDESLYKLRMANYRLLKPAMWSCTSLATQQDRVLEILKKIEGSHHHAVIKAWLGQVIRIAESERVRLVRK